MKKLLLMLMILSVSVITGCESMQSTTGEEVTVDEYSDEEVIVESDDGMDPEEQRLREGDGYMMNLVESYTMPISEGDSEASPEEVLIDSSGKEYKIVDHIGPETIQK